MDTYYRSRSNGRFVFSADDLKDIENRDEFYAPVVVIDPEDREQVERLYDLISFAGAHRGRIFLSDAIDRTAAALREFAAPTPPRPEEPTGLGAVVEDAEGERWVRCENVDLVPHWYARNKRRDDYADIAAVRVLSEGVTQ